MTQSVATMVRRRGPSVPLAYLGWWTQAEGSATKKQRSSTPPGEEIPEKIKKDLWEVWARGTPLC